MNKLLNQSCALGLALHLAVIVFCLSACSESSPAVASKMMLGYSEADITPPLGTPLGGFGAPGGYRTATAVHDPILAQVAFFSNDLGQSFVIITLDSAGYSYDFGDWGPGIADLRRSIAAEVADQLSLEPEHILVTSSHTHSGPDHVGFWQTPHNGPAVEMLEEIITKVTMAAVQALANQVEVNLHFAHTELAGYSKRDSDCSDVIDNSVEVLQAKTLANQVIVTIANYANHPTMMPESNTELSADFVWGFRQEMQNQTSAPSMFIQGYIAAVHHKNVPSGDGVWDPAMNMGVLLAEAVIEATFSQAKDFDISHQWKLFSCVAEGAYVILAYRDFDVMKRYLDDDGTTVTVEQIEVSWHKLGPAEFAVMPGEPTAEISFAFKERMNSPYKFMVGLGNDSIGYLIDQASIDKDQSGQLSSYELEMGLGRPGGQAAWDAMASLSWFDDTD
ncbi:MAG: hypothetical protein JRJ19_05060 [Deltaproteobacteria bacterium]|nr:hypothetical protein [Deltaproteobacteria bacterium]